MNFDTAEIDAITCEVCKRKCGQDLELGYVSEYECCEDCVDEVEVEIESRREHERDCMSLIVPSSWR